MQGYLQGLCNNVLKRENFASDIFSSGSFKEGTSRVGRCLLGKTPMRILFAMPLMAVLCLKGSEIHAETAFDGFRFGIESIYSRTQLEVDITHPKRAALDQADARIAQGEADLASATVRLNAGRANQAIAQRNLVSAQDQLTALEQRSKVSPEIAALMASDMVRMRSSIAQATANLRQQSDVLASSLQSLEAGEAALRAGKQSADAMRTYPDVSNAVMEGVSVRLSLGWGTSLTSSFGPIHIGIEADFSPGVGSTTVRVPERYDTHIQAPLIVGTSAKAGWVVCSWAMPYVTVGAEAQRWTIERNVSRRTNWSPGLRIGAGVEFALFDRTLVRVGYDHVFMQDVNFSGASVSRSADIFRIGLIRTF